ncbi:MAG: hypothetical protein ACHQTE_01445, partial [Candidatus Saccharimonadales bacterium]
SAQAGVEDGKRVLLINQSCQNLTLSGPICTLAKNAIAANKCNTIAAVLGNNPAAKETIVQQSDGGRSAQLDQAYTCVEINLNTDDYKGTISANQSNIIPLKGQSAFDTVELSWHSRDDLTSAAGAVTFPAGSGQVTLPPAGQWGVSSPALMRAQLMQTGTNFTLDSFNDSQAGNKSNANTLFLYPGTPFGGGTQTSSFALDARRVAGPLNVPRLVACKSSFAAGDEYICTVRIAVPAPIDGNTAAPGAFLRLSALYNGTHYDLKLYKGPTLVPFDGVQPIIDSTGRANNMFRRVQARVELTGNFTYPEAAVDISGSLCKNFSITDQPTDYENSTTCTP